MDFEKQAHFLFLEISKGRVVAMISETDFQLSAFINPISPNSATLNAYDTDFAHMPRDVWPVFFVLDCSAGMAGARIDALNQAVSNIIMKLLEYQATNPNTDIRVGLLRVGSDCRWLSPVLTPVCDFSVESLTADGLTAFGQAFLELDNQLSRRNMLNYSTNIKSPLIIFTTDGMPTDLWKEPLESLKKNKWYQKAIKIVVGIGGGVEYDYLVKLVDNPNCVLLADNPDSIIMQFEEIVPLMNDLLCFHDDAPLPQDDHKEVTGQIPFICPVPVDNAYGRAKCKLLKSFRKAIADANNIPYEITECYSQGQCNGACPECDKEAEDFSKLLAQKALSGQAIQMPNMDTSLFDEFLPNKVSELLELPENKDPDIFEGWMGLEW